MDGRDFRDPRTSIALLDELAARGLTHERFQQLHHKPYTATVHGHKRYARITGRFLDGSPNAETARRFAICLQNLKSGVEWSDAIATALTQCPVGFESEGAPDDGEADVVGREGDGSLHSAAVLLALGADRIDEGRYSTKQTWRAGVAAWNEAKAAGRRMPILFGDAVNDSGDIFRWAVIRELDVTDEGTSVRWEDVCVLSGRVASDLIKLKDREPVDRYIRRVYTVVATPDWLGETAADAAPSVDDETEIIDAPDDALEYELQLRRLRAHQSEFRSNLMIVYEGQCAISGCDVDAVLEAAHIDPHSKTGDNSTDNGLLLRADLHALFDRGLLLIDPEALKIRLAASITDSEYRTIEGRALRSRIDGVGPRRTALLNRWAQHSEALRRP